MKKKEADKRGKKKRGGGKGMTGSSGNQQKRKTPEDRKRERKQKEFQEQYNAMTPEQQAKVDKQIAADNAFLESQVTGDDDDL